jgi:uncharacterized protein YbbC (DUF1343 family)
MSLETRTGIDQLLADPALRGALRGRRCALVAHPASVTHTLEHSLDVLAAHPDIELTSALGPQHGIRGDKQYNMVESQDFVDSRLGIPVYSLYGTVRRPTPPMLEHCDVVLVDLQDVGCRVFTYEATLRYVLEAASQLGKSVWVLDRPNPVGRPIEGLALRPGQESFVGVAPIPMRHGLTMGELAHYFVRTLRLGVDYRVIAMPDYDPNRAPGYGWPTARSWVNPSPNAASLNMTRTYPGSVMLEGTLLSEGRGTTRPLELFGAPDIDAWALFSRRRELAPQWLLGCRLRPCWFEPTFYKHQGQLCQGLQVHADGEDYDHARFRPWRLQALAFKALRSLRPDYALWRDFPYEYETTRLAIDVINGSPLLREWVDDAQASCADLDHMAGSDEKQWREERRPYLLYPDSV